jgi:hypothetical protein
VFHRSQLYLLETSEGEVEHRLFAVVNRSQFIFLHDAKSSHWQPFVAPLFTHVLNVKGTIQPSFLCCFLQGGSKGLSLQIFIVKVPQPPQNGWVRELCVFGQLFFAQAGMVTPGLEMPVGSKLPNLKPALISLNKFISGQPISAANSSISRTR